MKQIDLMVFDLDGTLVRSGEDLAVAVNHTLKTLGFPALDSNTVQGFVGDGLEALVKKALGPSDREYHERAMAIFYSHYSEHLLDHTTLYPDILTVLEYFADKMKVVVTKKKQQYAMRIAKGLGIDSYFLEIIGEDGSPYVKPDPRLLHLVMAKWGVTPGRTAVIGDGVNDVLFARQAGALSCAFLGGMTERGKLLSLAPDLTCETLSDLMSLLG
jgi:phosphoglycolate phosphatase